MFNFISVGRKRIPVVSLSQAQTQSPRDDRTSLSVPPCGLEWMSFQAKFRSFVLSLTVFLGCSDGTSRRDEVKTENARTPVAAESTKPYEYSPLNLNTPPLADRGIAQNSNDSSNDSKQEGGASSSIESSVNGETAGQNRLSLELPRPKLPPMNVVLSDKTNLSDVLNKLNKSLNDLSEIINAEQDRLQDKLKDINDELEAASDNAQKEKLAKEKVERSERIELLKSLATKIKETKNTKDGTIVKETMELDESHSKLLKELVGEK